MAKRQKPICLFGLQTIEHKLSRLLRPFHKSTGVYSIPPTPAPAGESGPSNLQSTKWPPSRSCTLAPVTATARIKPYGAKARLSILRQVLSEICAPLLRGIRAAETIGHHRDSRLLARRWDQRHTLSAIFAACPPMLATVGLGRCCDHV
jgi:hypothetical protein